MPMDMARHTLPREGGAPGESEDLGEPEDESAEIVFLLKGYPRLSETFIAQEIRGLEQRGLKIRIVALRRPTDAKTHPIIAEIRAPVTYLPEYLYQAPGRVLAGWRRARRLPGYRAALRAWLADLRRDPTPNRGRRFGQALVLAAELPAGAVRLHAHFLHTPASVARYAALMTGLPFSVSAHAKDIWTIPDWEKREKLAACDWLATCTAEGAAHLAALAPDPAKVSLIHHGLDLTRFPPPPAPRAPRDGSRTEDPVVILSIGRAVEKKGFDDLLAALSLLAPDLAWRFIHIGGGPLLAALGEQARALALASRVEWRGAQSQQEILSALRAADLFALASRIARDGDRDGLPNVLMEAASQGLATAATRAGAIGELLRDGETGLLVEPGDRPALAAAIGRLIGDPALRRRLGEAGRARLQSDFAFEPGIERLAAKLAARPALRAGRSRL
jgi:glycosyltransferase involved in cell wall biosynthesis